jgi:tetratricopeptide (TPR) repeat protein
MRIFFISLIFFLFYLTCSSQDITELLSDGNYFFENKYFLEAKDSYSKVLRIDYQNIDALIGRGKTYLELNIPDSSKIDFENAVNYYPLNHSTYYNLGRYFHFISDFDEALINYKKAIIIKQDTAIYYLAIAQTYKDKNIADSAFLYFNKALTIQSNYSDAYYYRAYYYYELGYFENAYSDIDKGLELVPNDIYLLTLKAYLQSFDENYDNALETCNLILSENPLFVPALEIRSECYFILDKLEEAINDAEFVLMQDSANLRAIIILSWSNYYLFDYEKSFFYAEKGKLIDDTNLDFYSLIGLSLFYTKKYPEAISEFEKAIDLQPDKMDFYDYKIQSVLLKNTSTSILTDNLLFKEINQKRITQLDEWVIDEKNKYYFPFLLNKFTNDNSLLGIDEYFMLYYGQVLQEGYEPYLKSDLKKMIRDEFSIGKYEETIKIASEILENDPFLIDAYQYIAYSYLYLKDYENYQKFMLPYHGFMSGIMATGIGDSTENAYIIASVTDEYSLLYFMGLFSSSQVLVEENGSYYDVLSAQDYYSNNQEIYFNIDKPFSSFSNKTWTLKKKRIKKEK